MPELPEVETLRRGLERLIIGHYITGVRILVPKMLKGSILDPDILAQVLHGHKIVSIARRGKHLIFTLDSGYYLLLHLKMRGQLRVVDQESPEEKYLAAVLTFDNGTELRFADMWTWGEIRLMTALEYSSHPALVIMGQEPCSSEWTVQSFGQSLAKKPKTTIKATLLDQTVIAGVGNIYADEALFRSHVLPTRTTNTLTDTEQQCLHQAIRDVLSEATEGGGATSDNYVDALGAVGRYMPKVYNRAGQACFICGMTLTRTKVIGRGTTYCSHCQK